MLGWALATFVKAMKIRLRKNRLFILALTVRSPPGWNEFVIDYDGYGFFFLLSANMGSQFLSNLPVIFISLTKVASAHPSINYFQIFRCHTCMIDETFKFNHPKIWKYHIFSYLADYIQKCQLFFRHSVAQRTVDDREHDMTHFANFAYYVC